MTLSSLSGGICVPSDPCMTLFTHPVLGASPSTSTQVDLHSHPYRCGGGATAAMAATLGCPVSSFPQLYLGPPPLSPQAESHTISPLIASYPDKYFVSCSGPSPTGFVTAWVSGSKRVTQCHPWLLGAGLGLPREVCMEMEMLLFKWKKKPPLEST